MANGEKKGITTKVDLEHHAKARQYMSEHGNMNMETFITQAIDSLVNAKEGTGEVQPEKQRTIAFQVPESVYQKLKDRLKQGKVNQKDFMTELLEKEIERDLVEQANQKEKLDALNEEDAEEELEEAEETEAQAQIAEAEEEEELSEDEVSEDESMGYDGPSMVM